MSKKSMHGICSSYTWNRILTFTMPKTITLLIWQIGLIHKILQLLVIGYLVYSLYENVCAHHTCHTVAAALALLTIACHVQSSWAYKEVPVESVNAFVEIGANTNWDEATGLYVASAPPAWCADPAYSFKWSESYDYTNPSCVAMNAHESTQKFPEPAVSNAWLSPGSSCWRSRAQLARPRLATCRCAQSPPLLPRRESITSQYSSRRTREGGTARGATTVR